MRVEWKNYLHQREWVEEITFTYMKNQIGDYAFLDKTSRSWHLWIGNPFCIGREIISLKKATEKDLIRFAGKAMKEEKKRFMKEFPDIKWKPIEQSARR